MKTIKVTAAILLAVSILLSTMWFIGEVVENNERKALMSVFVRLHIRAENDSDQAQNLKLQVRNDILTLTTALIDGVECKSDAMQVFADNTDLIQKTAEESVAVNGGNCAVSVSLKNEYFEYREYDGFFLPAGYYDSLIIELGEGIGHNWWCVIFPAVCISGCVADIEVDTENVPEQFRLPETPVSDDVKFDFWIVDFFRKLF